MLMFPIIDTNSDHFLKRMLHRYLNCKSVKNDNIFVIKTKCKQRMEERLEGTGRGWEKREKSIYFMYRYKFFMYVTTVYVKCTIKKSEKKKTKTKLVDNYSFLIIQIGI